MQKCDICLHLWERKSGVPCWRRFASHHHGRLQFSAWKTELDVPLLVNSSTAWSPPGWCISKRDPPGDPWCRTMNFPNQPGFHKVCGGLFLFTSGAWRIRNPHLSNPETSSLASFIIASRFYNTVKASGQYAYFQYSRIITLGLHISALIKKNDQGNQQTFASSVGHTTKTREYQILFCIAAM